MHRAEIRRLQGRIAEKGYTLVPLQVYFKNSLVKVEIGLARGKEALRQAPGHCKERSAPGGGERV